VSAAPERGSVRAPREKGALEGGARTNRVVAVSLGVAGIGLAGLLLGLHGGDRGWFSYLAAWTFATSLALGSLLLVMVGHVAKAGWMVVTRRLAEAVASALPLCLLLFVPIALGLPHLYPWARPETADSPSLRRAIAHTHAYLNPPFFVVRTGLYFAIFIAVGALLASWSAKNDRAPSLALVLRMRRLSGGALPLVALALTWASFDWIMSLEPDWSSTIFGMYFFAGSFVGAVALVAAVMGFVPGTSRPVTADHAQALGRVLFAMIIFWAYMAFSQLLIYWIGDVPEEIDYYRWRTAGSWSAVTASLIVGHFFAPFGALLSRHWKRNLSFLGSVAAWVLAMHFVDAYWMVLPNIDRTGVRLHWLDAAALLFVGGLCAAWVVRRYAALSPMPLHVPELDAGLDYEAAL
jgi:hypothetical protein